MRLRLWLSDFFALPLVMRIGLIIVVFGGALDVVFHASPSSWTPAVTMILGSEGYWAHIVTLIGMIITLVGMLLAAYRNRIHPAEPGK